MQPARLPERGAEANASEGRRAASPALPDLGLCAEELATLQTVVDDAEALARQIDIGFRDVAIGVNA